MSIVLSNERKVENLSTYLSTLNANRIILFVNDYIPLGTMTTGTFTSPSDSGGGEKIPVWAAVTLTAGNKAQTVAAPLTWVFAHNAGDFTVYGYYCAPTAGDSPLFAERFASPVTITAAGQTLTITPKYTRDAA